MPSTVSTATGTYQPASATDGTPPRLALLRPTGVLVGLLVAADVAGTSVAVTAAGGTRPGLLAFLAAAVGTDLLDRRSWRRLNLSALDDAPFLALRGLTIATLGALVGAGIHGERIPWGDHGSGVLLAGGGYAAVGLLGRAGGYQVIRRLRAAGRLRQPALVVGATPIGSNLARRLMEHPEYGLAPAGFVDDTAVADPDRLPAPVLGDIADLPKLIANEDVRHVFVAFCHVRDAQLVEVLRWCDRLNCEVYVVPRLFELGVAAGHRVDHLWDIPLLRLRRTAHRSLTWRLKRLLDVLVAAVGLVLAAPLMLVVAALLRRDGGPGVLFRQERVGLDGRHFVLVKFRTLRPPPAGQGGSWSRIGADRMSPLGRFLRRSSLDELPQLWNVLCGHMSLVGPRPEQPQYVHQFARRHHRYSARHRVPAGMTGLAQIHDLRGDTSIVDRVRFDNLYIEHWSLWRDIKILARTVSSVFGMRGG